MVGFIIGTCLVLIAVCGTVIVMAATYDIVRGLWR
jgi:hypothetical protein